MKPEFMQIKALLATAAFLSLQIVGAYAQYETDQAAGAEVALAGDSLPPAGT